METGEADGFTAVFGAAGAADLIGEAAGLLGTADAFGFSATGAGVFATGFSSGLCTFGNYLA